MNRNQTQRILKAVSTCVISLAFGGPASAASSASPTESLNPEALCRRDLAKLPGKFPGESLEKICKGASHSQSCVAVSGSPIYYLDRVGSSPASTSRGKTPGEPNPGSQTQGKRILVFALIHGDEPESATLARDWLLRLSELEPRNQWRVVPILNPDGWDRNTRANANGVDLNRNFPTRDWDQNAQLYWKKKAASHPRRFPGHTAGSEPEVHCAVSLIEEFKPDLIVSIHTPYGLLDFDGPTTNLPRVTGLPARRLGNFPGSLGRFMWADRKVPVLTIELQAKLLEIEQAVKLQDSIGDLAVRIDRKLATSPTPTRKQP